MHLKNTTTIGKLQMDVKYITPELSGLPHTCFEYAVVDIYSRYKEAVDPQSSRPGWGNPCFNGDS